MKQLTSNMSTFLSTKTNVEPVIIFTIDWAGNGHNFMYSDKDIHDVSGRILDLGDLESLLSTKTGSSNSVQVTLDDIDGTIKQLLNEHDPYGKPCLIYQYFDDSTLTLVDKILMFKGHINYDVTWSEGERAVTLTILTKVEEREVGFSPEEGQFDFVSEDKVGKPWPLCFGSPLDVPTTLIRSANTASLNDSICIVDPLLIWKRTILYQAILANYSMHRYYQSVASSFMTTQDYTAHQLLDELLRLINERFEAINTYNTILTSIAIKKEELFLAIRGRGPGNPKAIRAELSALRTQRRVFEDTVGPTHGDIELLETLIPELEASIQQRSDALDKQYEAIAQLSSLFQQYLTLEIEICKQKECETTSIHVKNGDNFEQNVDVDVYINNLQFRGQFDNDVFNIIAMLPKYRDITLAARETLPSTYDPNEHYATFWLPNDSIRLRGLYILVDSSHTGHKHIAKVVEQEGRLCHIQLVPSSRKTQSDEINDQVNWTTPAVTVGTQLVDRAIFQNVGLPVGDFTIVGMDNFIVPVTSPLYMTSLGHLPFDVDQSIRNTFGYDAINRDTFELLLRLSKIREKDNQLFQVGIGDLSVVKAYTLTTYHFDTIIEASPMILSHWLDDSILVAELPSNAEWSADQGAVISRIDDSCEVRVANILASEVKSVSAFRTVEGFRSLVTLPTRHYTTQHETLGPLTLTTIRTAVPLSALNDGWEDDIFVSLTSSVGPNVADIIQHLIETYTDKSVDTASFTSVKTLIANYPAHFALLTRKNVFEQINEIAIQARCVVYVINDVYFIKYLSVRPTPVRTLTQKDVIQGTLNVHYTDLTGVVTRLIATWNKDYSGQDEPNKVTLRHNIKKYGLHEREQQYYIYNIESLVEKSATFWLIRNCNSWKLVQFETNLDHLDLETFDAITLDLPHISNGSTLAVIQDVQLTNNRVTLSVWLPILSGEMLEDTFAWSGSSNFDDEYALDNEDVGSGNAIITGELDGC